MAGVTSLFRPVGSAERGVFTDLSFTHNSRLQPTTTT